AVPSRPTVAVPSTTLPSRNVTVPDGAPAPGATIATVAVKVTAWPVTAGLTDEPRATVVEARLMVSVKAAEVLCVKPPVPAKEAVRTWLPTPSDTFKLAWPLIPTRAVPRTVVPSKKVTVPVGTPAAEVTVAVSVTAGPETVVGADVPSVVVVAAAVTGAEAFNSTPTVLEEALAATRSTRPSPFRSAAATPKGSLPPVQNLSGDGNGAPNAPSPFRVTTVSPSGRAASPPTATSSRPSLLKSPRATSPSPPVVPGLWRMGARKVPSPLPSSTPS